VTTQLTDHGRMQVLRATAKAGGNFVELIRDQRGLFLNAWIGGSDPTNPKHHNPPNGKVRGVGAALSDDDIHALIRFLEGSLQKDEPALCFRGGDLGQSDGPRVVSACDQSVPRASEVLLDAAREMAKRVNAGYTEGDPGGQALAFTQAANAAKDLETRR